MLTFNIRNEFSQTPFIVATRFYSNDKNGVKIVDALIPVSNINAVDIYGNSALMYAAELGSSEIVKRLLQAGANTHIKNQNGKTALVLAKEKLSMHLSMLENEFFKISVPKITGNIEKQNSVIKLLENIN